MSTDASFHTYCPIVETFRVLKTELNAAYCLLTRAKRLKQLIPLYSGVIRTRITHKRRVYSQTLCDHGRRNGGRRVGRVHSRDLTYNKICSEKLKKTTFTSTYLL